MNNLIKEDYILGNKKIVVGDNLHDLVLENLGKIWVRYGNGYKEFSQFVSTLAKAVTSVSKVVIEPDGMQPPESYKSGQLVFDARKKNLYLKFEESLLLLLEYNDNINEKYVAKAGDTMTGRLTIEVQDGSPLKVNSAELVKNLNANYLEGKKAENFAQKAKDEEITGNWTFQGNDNHNGLNTFNNKVIIDGELEENSTSKFARKATFNNEIEVARTATFKQIGGTAIKVGTGDIVTDGSIGSSQFMSGMTGYGWRLDANTNTLTIDNLIVRGVLNVFELIVNKISATNGSFWITDSFKIDKVYEVEYLNRDTLTVTNVESYHTLLNKFSIDKYFVVYGNDFNKYTITPDLNEHPFATRNNQNPTVEHQTFDKFRRIFKINHLDNFKDIFTPEIENNVTTYKDLTILTDAQLITLNNTGVISLSNMFQRNPERITDMEVLDNEHLLNPWAETDFEDCKFTIVDTSQATLEDGKYIYDNSAISRINLYCKYFGATLTSSTLGDSNMRTWVLECKHDEFPVFKPGDILKCQKFEGNSVKQYHALVLGLADSYSYIVQLQNYSVVQEGTILEYDTDGNLSNSQANLDTTLYDRSMGLTLDLEDYLIKAREILNLYAEDITSQTTDTLTWAVQVLITPENVSNYTIPTNPTQEQAATWVNNVISHQINGLSYEECLQHPIFKRAFEQSTLNTPAKDDSLVRIGSIMYSDRRNSMYLTSSEQNSPYTDVLVGVNRPDYSVLYLTPKYVKFEATDTDRKGQYYLQDDVFGNIMEQGSNNTGNDKVIYDKYKNFVIKHDITSEGETNLQKTFVKLTFLSDENTLHNQDGSLMTQDVESVDYFVSSANSNIINNTSFVNEDIKSAQIIQDQNTISLTIGRGGASNTFDGLLDVGILDIKREDDSIFIQQGNNISVNLLPALRTNSNNIYDDKNYPVSVVVTETIFTDSGSSEKYYPIKYNSNYTLSLNNVRSKKIKITFTVGGVELRKTIQFYILPNSLYEKYFGEGNDYNTFSVSEYNSVIDALTGNPVISKYGCLLLTNKYDVIETVEIEGNIKGLAELIPTTKVRMGNLNGIYNETFGTNQPRGFGLYGESVYLTGNFYLNNGKSLVDISNDITLAVGNINRIQNTLNNLKATLQDSIYNLTVSTTASFSQAISENKDAIFKLGKDYSLWAVGNAGISIINPNVKYDSNGNVDDSTIGDGDEYIFMQGESVQIATSISKDNNNETYFRVIVCTSSPQGFKYNDNDLYRPYIDNNTRPSFYVGWINKNIFNSATKVNVNQTETTKLFRYVALNKHQNSGQIQIANAQDTLSLDNHDFYSFSISREIDGSDIYQDDSFNNTFSADYNYYVIKDVVISGMFEDGKFNTNLIEVKNLLAIDLASRDGQDQLIYKKNPNFNIDQEISNTNYPVLYTDNSAIATDAPFVVVSGTTGKITAQGMQMREATIGKESGKHIKITDNTGIKVTPDYFNNNAGTASVPESEPAVYLRDGEDIIAEFSSKKGKQLEKFFKNTSTSIVGSGNSSFNLGTASGSTNSAVITYNRNLTVANATTNSNGWQNKTILGQFSGNNGIVNVAFLYHHTTTTSEQNPNGNTYWYYDQQNEAWSCPEYFAANIDVYKMTPNMYDRFIPTKTSYEYIGDSDQNTSVQALINSDIGRVQYTTEDSLTFEKVIKTGIELTSDNIYEIQGNFMATISQFSELISSQKKEVNSFLTNNSLTGLISNAVDNEGNPINVTGLNNNITGMFTLTLSFGLYNGETLIKTLKSIKYSESCSKIYINNDNFNFKNYLNENDIYNIDEDSVETSKADVISEIKRSISNEFSNSSIRFSGLIKPNQDYNNLTLKATLKVNLAIDTKMSEYSFTKSHNNNDYSSIIDSDIIGSWDVYRRTYGDSDVPTYSEVTPNNDRYYWHPLLSPEIYTIKPKVRVTNCSINLIKVKERTAIQGNGFLTGYEEDNKFEVSFIEKSNQVQFRKSEFVGGIGEILNNSGIYNAFRLNNQEYTINKMIPILYGTFYPDAGTINIQGTGDYSEVSYPASKSRYHYYNFSGYSLFSATDSELGITNTYRIFTNVFKPITGISNINGFGYLHYDPKYDLYICSGDSNGQNGQIVILFGNNWNNLFSRYGKHIILSLVPKYYLYTYVFTQTTFTAYKPIVVNNSGIYNSVDLTYKKILSYTKNGRMYTLNFGNEITQSNLFGFEVDCWALDMSINSDNHDMLNSVLGYFDIIVNYIPDLS